MRFVLSCRPCPSGDALFGIGFGGRLHFAQEPEEFGFCRENQRILLSECQLVRLHRFDKIVELFRLRVLGISFGLDCRRFSISPAMNLFLLTSGTVFNLIHFP